jgi:hypothetical protein
MEGESEVFVDEGSAHTITCRVESPTPPHHIFWYFQGQVSNIIFWYFQEQVSYTFRMNRKCLKG